MTGPQWSNARACGSCPADQDSCTVNFVVGIQSVRFDSILLASTPPGILHALLCSFLYWEARAMALLTMLGRHCRTARSSGTLGGAAAQESNSPVPFPFPSSVVTPFSYRRCHITRSSGIRLGWVRCWCGGMRCRCCGNAFSAAALWGCRSQTPTSSGGCNAKHWQSVPAWYLKSGSAKGARIARFGGGIVKISLFNADVFECLPILLLPSSTITNHWEMIG